MLFLLLCLAFFGLLLSAAFTAYLISQNNKQETFYRARIERDEERFVEILKAQAEREREFLRESRDRDEAFVDRLLERKNIDPIKPQPPAPPAPLMADWTETDMNLFKSWAAEEIFRADSLGEPRPNEEALEKLYKDTYGRARPVEAM